MNRRIVSSASMLLFLSGAVATVSGAPRGLRGGGGGGGGGGGAPFQNVVTISVEGDVRVIRANGIPDHQTGRFPGPGNPNTIGPQKYEFRVPLHPKPAEKTTALRMQPFGVAVNGVVFDPGAAEWWNGDRNSGWQYEPLMMAPLYLGTDASHAHVQPNGAYHYHGIPTALVYALTGGTEKMVIVGWAADGFPIYNNLGHIDPRDASSPLKTLKSSYRVKSGQRPNGPGGPYDGRFVADYEYVPRLGDLDDCNGRFGVTPEYPDGIYHYVLTEQFPFIPRKFRGTPDPSFMRRPGGGGGAREGGPDGAFHLIPPFALRRVNLTDEQRRQIEPLDQEARERLEKILTPEQLQILKESRPPRGLPGAPDGPGPDDPADRVAGENAPPPPPR
jgi:YHYH protein